MTMFSPSRNGAGKTQHMSVLSDGCADVFLAFEELGVGVVKANACFLGRQ